MQMGSLLIYLIQKTNPSIICNISYLNKLCENECFVSAESQAIISGVCL